MKVSGKGTVYSFVVVHQATMPGFAQDVPYVAAWIEFPEQSGLKMISNVIDCEPSEVFVGMSVEVTFEDVTEDVTLPKFRPTKG